MTRLEDNLPFVMKEASTLEIRPVAQSKPADKHDKWVDRSRRLREQLLGNPEDEKLLRYLLFKNSTRLRQLTTS